MDFLTRPPSAADSHDSAIPEEPEYLARYVVTKHSWRGKYKRILCISSTSIITLDPATLATTNAYEVASDFESASPLPGRDDTAQQQQALEFTINLRTEGRGKFKAIKFSSRWVEALQLLPLDLRCSRETETCHRNIGRPSANLNFWSTGWVS